jgi:hypothetical protein
MYRWQAPSKRSINPSPAREQPVKMDDDLVDALRYAIFSNVRGTLKAWEPIAQHKGNVFDHLRK